MPPRTLLLGTAQDGGIPHVGCRRPCCLDLDEARFRLPCCLGILDPETGQRWMIDCTPEFPHQLRRCDQHVSSISDSGDFRNPGDRGRNSSPEFAGILLTHAHIGHYAGLISLGTEAMASEKQPVFVMPRMRRFLETNEPWKRLIQNGNVELRSLTDGESLRLSERVTATPLSVPHRDEFSETVAFVIAGPDRSALYLPDIDAWDQWSTKIEDVVARVDVAYLDGTFFDNGELPQRSQNSVPHPRIVDSLQRFSVLPNSERAKIRFLHFNHTNSALIGGSDAEQQIVDAGMNLATELETIAL